MSLNYDLLPAEQKKALWKEFFQLNIKEDRMIEFTVDAEDYVCSDKVTKMRLNGRDIRNG
jgi:hypothetical protein